MSTTISNIIQVHLIDFVFVPCYAIIYHVYMSKTGSDLLLVRIGLAFARELADPIQFWVAIRSASEQNLDGRVILAQICSSHFFHDKSWLSEGTLLHWRWISR